MKTCSKCEDSELEAIKIYYSPGGNGLPAETGWAERLKDNKVRINNIPIFSEFHGGDIVTITDNEDDSFPQIIDLVERRYPIKAAITYADVKDFDKVATACKEKDWMCEGGFGPRPDRPGLMQVCCEDIDVQAWLEELGVEAMVLEHEDCDDGCEDHDE